MGGGEGASKTEESIEMFLTDEQENFPIKIVVPTHCYKMHMQEIRHN